MNIVKKYISSTRYSLKCPYTMNPKWITVHNTANDATARNEVLYMQNNNNKVSFHDAVDDKEIVCGIPHGRSTYNAGDGNGEGNRASISIEICYSLSGGYKFTKAEENAAEYIAYLLNEHGWDISHVKKHQDWNGKYCPHRTLDMGWQRFLNMIQKELDKYKKDETPVSKTKYKEGDKVTTTKLSTTSGGAKVYTGKWSGTITKILEGRAYPYLLNSNTGWTNDAGIDATSTKPSTPPTPSTPSTKPDETYQVVKTINGYMNAANAKAGKSPVSKVIAGTYYIFNEASGMKNVTKTKGVAGSWINPADNVVEKVIKKGSKVKLKTSASTYQGASKGVKIPSSVKGKTYTVQQVSTDGKTVLLKEIVSWVLKSDCEIL